MTYPDTSGADKIDVEHLQKILREVDLEYLLNRCTTTDEKTGVKSLTMKVALPCHLLLIMAPQRKSQYA